MAFLFSPFRSSYRYLHTQAHENPVLFYSCIIGAIGPVMAFTVPPIREHFGYVRPAAVPLGYIVPDRPRRPVHGYEDEEQG